MGDSVEQWRAKIGQWNGGSQHKCVTLQHRIAETSNQIGYKHIRFLVLVSLLVIGCVELNPGPDHETSAPAERPGALPKFHRRPGTSGQHGELYEQRLAEFLFARALKRTEEFQLASNVDGAGTFDDLVFRYRLREQDVWKTCFIQLKHKEKGGTIQRSSLTEMSGDFSLLKYFKSYCEIKNNVATDRNLKQCGSFGDFEFVIYTNGKWENKPSGSKSPPGGGDSGPGDLINGSVSPPGEEDSDPLRILSSGAVKGKYITFDENRDTDIFEFFEEVSGYHKLIKELDNTLNCGKSQIEDFQINVRNKQILGKLDSPKLNPNKDNRNDMIKEVSECDLTLFKEFLSKVKIFHSQSNEKSFKRLIGKELQEACKASQSAANFIYTKLEEGFSKWCAKKGNVVWLSENSGLWQSVQKDIITEIENISNPEIQDIVKCDIRFNEQHLRKLSDAIKQNTVLHIVTNSKDRNLQKLKTYQALNILGNKSSLFIGIKSLSIESKEINKLWPCKWSDVLVADCDSDDIVAHRVLDILQKSADFEKRLGKSDDNTAETTVGVLEKCQAKVILLSSRQEDSYFQDKIRNISYLVDNCDISGLDEKSQKLILERPVKFQGTNVTLSTLVGTDPPDSIKPLLDSNIISILLRKEHELSVGRQLGDHCRYYVPRVLQHQVYLKEDILKPTDYAVTFAVSGLHAEGLKKSLPAGQKICELVYDERERSHILKIVSDFSKTGLSVECGTMKTHQKLGQRMKSDDDGCNILGNKDAEIDITEGSKNNTFSIDVKFSKFRISAELENMKAYNQAGENVKPEEVRYIILGNKNPENEFRELKKQFRNVHWIHVEEGSFLWRDTNGNIDIIRRYIDNTKHQEYDTESVVEHNDRTMLLVAEPGMGKSTFLSYMEHEIKKWNPSVWVVRINLNEHTTVLEDNECEEDTVKKWQEFLWSAVQSAEQDVLNVTKELFLQALEETGKMVIMLDGFDEISPDYTSKVKMLIRTIRNETASKIWISSRFSYRQELEDFVGKFAFTLQPFTPENRIQFLVQYWREVTEISNQERLQIFAEKLLNLCSQNFSDKDGEFTGIPLQTMMLGEAFENSAKEYCRSGEFNLQEKFNLLDLFQKFWEKKCYIYIRDKKGMNTSKTNVNKKKESYLKKHMTSALVYLFSPYEIKGLEGEINKRVTEKAKKFLENGKAEGFGIIREITDGKPHFVHRCFAEYFAAKWFTDNFRECGEFISNNLFNPTNEVIRNIFDRMLAEISKIHVSVLNNDIHALKEILKEETDINALDKGERTALHLAAIYNSPYIQELVSFPVADANKPDAVLKWTPLRYADRTKSWRAMDILLQIGANPDDIVFTGQHAKDQEWGQSALWECASKGYIQLLEFMLNCGIEVNASVDVPDNILEKRTITQRAICCGKVEVVKILLNRGAGMNFRDVNKNTALHLAAQSGSVDILKLLVDKGISVNMTDINGSTPLLFSTSRGHLEATKFLVERGAAINSTNNYGDNPLKYAACKGKLEIFRYLLEMGADINIVGNQKYTALHSAATSGSVDIMKLLVDKGISVNLTNKYGCTPLHLSAELGDMEATKFLVERGAAINNSNKFGDTPMMLAAYKRKLEIFRYFIEIGADLNFLDNGKDTALHFAARWGNVDIMKLLVDKGMSVNLTDKNGHTPLHLSAELGHLKATKFLVDRGAAINSINKYDKTPLMLAALEGKLELFRYLLEMGADINILEKNKNSVLHLAARSGSVDILKLLLDKGISVNLTNEYGRTPLHLSADFSDLKATKFLFERGAAINSTNKYDKSPLMLAALEGKLEIIRYLLEMGADIHILDNNKNTALHLAAKLCNVDIMKLLVDKGISVNLNNKSGRTPLHFSAKIGDLEATKFLVERGAAINSTNKYGNSPLMLAAYKGKLEIFRYLLEMGAYINILDNGNDTALHLAARWGNVDIMKLLVDKGMSVNLTDKNGHTPLHLSAELGDLEATKFLVERSAAINSTNKYGNSPLMLVAYKGKLDIFRYLLKTVAEINSLDNGNDTAHHLAARWDNVGIMKLLVDN